MITVYYSAPELPGLGNSFKGVMTEPVIVWLKGYRTWEWVGSA